ncbi:Helix-turn-helix type 11 domain protein [Stackebrandtia nassauensis DSM 44728]|uniref:Helix-turn-helix type 11 domain protein n=2 Tax=Stackebrandtia TaxID=283810 RepID=D3Q7N8_STANL|nr:Helix-turn-helix type 11 domain protein [Stackebrandtia nassauensis DSM 44728]
MLSLLSLLQGGRSWTGIELAERLSTSPRTLRRDIDRLRELGYPVETTRGPGGHYRLVAGSAMPPLLLEDDEAVAIALGLRVASDGVMADVADTASSALRKVEQVLPKRLRQRVRAMHAATETTPARWPQVSARLLDIVGEASHRSQRLDFDYRDRGDARTRRRVEPYRQVLVNRRWYLLAWDLDRGDWRIFRMDRMSDPQVGPGRFEARELPAESAASFVENALKRYPPMHHIVVDFHAPLERVASLQNDRDGTLTRIDDEHCRYSVDADSFEWMAIMLGVLGLEYRIVGPEEFVEYSRKLAERIRESTEGKG